MNTWKDKAALKLIFSYEIDSGESSGSEEDDSSEMELTELHRQLTEDGISPTFDLDKNAHKFNESRLSHLSCGDQSYIKDLEDQVETLDERRQEALMEEAQERIQWTERRFEASAKRTWVNSTIRLLVRGESELLYFSRGQTPPCEGSRALDEHFVIQVPEVSRTRLVSRAKPATI